MWTLARTPTTRETDTHPRAPVLIFLSDGESNIGDKPMQKICRAALGRGFVYLFVTFTGYLQNKR